MKYLTQSKHWNIVKEYNCDKLLYLLIDRYDITTNVCFIWYNDKGEYHRDYYLPAFTDNSYLAWYKNNKCITAIVS